MQTIATTGFVKCGASASIASHGDPNGSRSYTSTDCSSSEGCAAIHFSTSPWLGMYAPATWDHTRSYSFPSGP